MNNHRSSALPSPLGAQHSLNPCLPHAHSNALPCPTLQVPADRALADPPLLRLEAEASQAYLSVLLHVQAAAPDTVRAACAMEARLTQLCLRNLERFEQQEAAAEEQEARGASGGTAGGWVDRCG